MVTYKQLRNAKLDTIQDQVDTWKSVAKSLDTLEGSASGISDKISNGTWEGTSGFAATGRAVHLKVELGSAKTEVSTVKNLLSTHKGKFVSQKKKLNDVVEAVEDDVRLLITDNGTVKPDVDSYSRHGTTPTMLELLEAQQAADKHNESIKAILAWVSLMDAQLSSKLRAAVNLDSPKDLDFNDQAKKDADAADFPGPADPKIAASQAKAFEKSLGRQPVTAGDWKLAAALDPKTHLDRNHGVDSVVKVGKITPHPGKGMVRIGMFIPNKDLVNVPNFNLGDDRGMNPQFDPESTRVAFYVDYETGTVLARQNPSAVEDEAQTGTPTVKIQETTQGSVRLQYDASDPYLPVDPPGDIAHVRGDITVTPGEGEKPRIDGTIGDYPSFEAYHDDNNGNTSTLVQDEADNDSAVGPPLELPFDHQLGNGQNQAAQFQEWRHLSGENWEAAPKPGAPETELGDPGSPPKSTPYEPYGGSESHPEVPGVTAPQGTI